MSKPKRRYYFKESLMADVYPEDEVFAFVETRNGKQYVKSAWVGLSDVLYSVDQSDLLNVHRAHLETFFGGPSEGDIPKGYIKTEFTGDYPVAWIEPYPAFGFTE